MSRKPVDVKNTEDLKTKVNDVDVYGDPDAWVLTSKAMSREQGWMKSTKCMNLPNGMLVQVSTQVKENVAEAITFVPGINVVKDGDKILYKHL